MTWLLTGKYLDKFCSSLLTRTCVKSVHWSKKRTDSSKRMKLTVWHIPKSFRPLLWHISDPHSILFGGVFWIFSFVNAPCPFLNRSTCDGDKMYFVGFFELSYHCILAYTNYYKATGQTSNEGQCHLRFSTKCTSMCLVHKSCLYVKQVIDEIFAVIYILNSTDYKPDHFDKGLKNYQLETT